MARTILLIDGDQYLYRAAAAAERDVRWDDENHVLVSNEVEVWETVEASFEAVRGHFGSHCDVVICMGEGPYFRHDLYPAYKPGRGRKPLCFYDVRAKIMTTYKTVSMPGIEADDVMGILSTKPGPDERIIVAKDKDMKGVPGKLWTGDTFLNITNAAADYFHLYQTLVGDTADGYKGCPAIGDKKATKLLEPFMSDESKDCPQGLACKGCLRCCTSAIAWPTIVEAFEKAGLTADDALLQARLARILRWSDWDSANKKPILWTPQ